MRLVRLCSRQRGPATVYVQGFCAQSRVASDFRDWFDSHRRISAAEPEWAGPAWGLSWPTGDAGGSFDNLGGWPVPAASAAWFIMRRASRLPVGGAVAAVAADVLLTAARAALHFRETERTLKTAAPAMAELLYGLHKETGGYRVVAHSLGVRMAVEAISELPIDARPTEAHLCGAACTASQLAGRAEELSRGERVHYYNPRDLTLRSAYRLVARESAAGVAPLIGIESINASTHLAASYSHQYAAFFDTLALEALRRRRARDAPS